MFAVGAVLSNFPINYAFMRWPVMGEPLTLRDYFAGAPKCISGACCRTYLAIRTIFISWSPMPGWSGPAVSTRLVRIEHLEPVGASCVEGIQGCAPRVVRLLVLMFLFFILGLTAVAWRLSCLGAGQLLLASGKGRGALNLLKVV